MLINNHSSSSSLIVCYRTHQLYYQTSSACDVPYATFSQSYIIPLGLTTTTTSRSVSSQCTCSPPPSRTVPQEESLTHLLTSRISKESHKIGETISSKPMMIEWTKRNLFSLVK
jgi:hypothetical protein